MSDTPRTDAHERASDRLHQEPVVRIDFARKLERELAAAQSAPAMPSLNEDELRMKIAGILLSTRIVGDTTDKILALFPAALSVAPQKTQAIGCQEATNSKVEAAPQKETELSNDMTGTGPFTSAGSVPYFRQQAIKDMNDFADALENGPTLRAIWAELYEAGYAPPSMDHVEGVKMVCAELKRLQMSCGNPTPPQPAAATGQGEDTAIVDWLEKHQHVSLSHWEHGCIVELFGETYWHDRHNQRDDRFCNTYRELMAHVITDERARFRARATPPSARPDQQEDK